jgi:hypothetical protein
MEETVLARGHRGHQLHQPDPRDLTAAVVVVDRRADLQDQQDQVAEVQAVSIHHQPEVMALQPQAVAADQAAVKQTPVMAALVL